jgi:cell division FtsZ-interacting protein ZapD
MSQKTYQINLSFDQIFDLVKQLPQRDKLRLSKELEKDTLNQKLTQLLETFKTDELSLETITEEVETVRTELYGQQSSD